MQDLPEFQEKLPTDDTFENSHPNFSSDHLVFDSVTDPLKDNCPYVITNECAMPDRL